MAGFKEAGSSFKKRPVSFEKFEIWSNKWLEETGVTQKGGSKADYQGQVQSNKKNLPGLWSGKKEMGSILTWKEKHIKRKNILQYLSNRKKVMKLQLLSWLGLDTSFEGITKKVSRFFFLITYKNYLGGGMDKVNYEQL